MRIQRIKFSNYRGFPYKVWNKKIDKEEYTYQDLELEFDSKTNLHVLIGTNGSGKTGILQGIAYLLYQFIQNVTSDPANEIKVYPDYIFSKDDMSVHTDNKEDLRLDADIHFLEKNYSLYIEGTTKPRKEIEPDLDTEKNEVFEPLEHSFSVTHDLRKFIDLRNELYHELEQFPDSTNVPICVFYPTNRMIEISKQIEEDTHLNCNQFYTYINAFTNELNHFNQFPIWFKEKEDLENYKKIESNCHCKPGFVKTRNQRVHPKLHRHRPY